MLDTFKKNAGGDLGGENFVGTLANKGVRIAPFHEFDSQISAELKAEIEALRAEIADGTIKVADYLEVVDGLTVSPSDGRPLSASGAGGSVFEGRTPMRLELKDITKQFPGVLANDQISISADRGEVLGLLGENGAGKTTLMNILSGLYRPDSGEILIDGTPRAFDDPAEAIDAGIGMVHQHFQLVPVFDVVEAVALGAESVRVRSARSTARPRASGSSSSPSSTTSRRPRRQDRGPPRSASASGSRSSRRSTARATSSCSTSRPRS